MPRLSASKRPAPPPPPRRFVAKRCDPLVPTTSMIPLSHQSRIGVKAAERLSKSRAVEVKMPAGSGKTLMAGVTHALFRRNHLSLQTLLTVVVCPRASIAVEHASRYGILAEHCNLQSKDLRKLAKKPDLGDLNIISITPRIITPRTLGGTARAEDTTNALEELAKRFDNVLLIVDEVSVYLQSRTHKLPERVAELRLNLGSSRMYIMGMASDPDVRGRLSQTLFAKRRFMLYGTLEPHQEECSNEEFLSATKDMHWQGKLPDRSEFAVHDDIVDPPTEQRGLLNEALLGFALCTLPGPTWPCSKWKNNKWVDFQWDPSKHFAAARSFVSRVASELEMQQLLRGRVTGPHDGLHRLGAMEKNKECTRVESVGSTGNVTEISTVAAHQTVLLLPDNAGGMFAANSLVKEVDSNTSGSNGYASYKLFDMATGTEAKRMQMIGEFLKHGLLDECVSVGIVNRNQTRATDAFGKNVSACIAVGSNISEEMKDSYLARLCRTVPVEVGDVYAETIRCRHVRCRLTKLLNDAMGRACLDDPNSEAPLHAARMDVKYQSMIIDVAKRYGESSPELMHLIRLFDADTHQPFAHMDDLAEKYVEMLKERADGSNTWKQFQETYHYERNSNTYDNSGVDNEAECDEENDEEEDA